MGRSGTGDLNTRRRALRAGGCPRTPVPEPPLSMCVKSKKNDCINSKLHSLEEAVKNSDAKHFWKCLKSMDDAVKVEDTPLVSKEDWLLHFESLHSNDRLNHTQHKICNELQEEEDRKKQFRPLDHLITENEKSCQKIKEQQISSFRQN